MRRSAKTVGVVSLEAVEDLDDAALLGDEDAPVGREAHGRRIRQTAEDDLLLEPGRQGSSVAGLGEEETADTRRDPNRDGKEQPCPTSS